MEKERINANLHKTIYELMKSDESVVVLGEDVAEPYGGAFKITKNLSEEFPTRVINTPISEEGFVNMATGMAMMGYKPIVATVYKGNIIKNLIMDCQSYTKYRPNETTGGIFVSWRRKEELPTGA